MRENTAIACRTHRNYRNPESWSSIAHNTAKWNVSLWSGKENFIKYQLCMRKFIYLYPKPLSQASITSCVSIYVHYIHATPNSAPRSSMTRFWTILTTSSRRIPRLFWKSVISVVPSPIHSVTIASTKRVTLSFVSLSQARPSCGASDTSDRPPWGQGYRSFPRIG